VTVTDRVPVHTDSAPPQGGPYSQAIRAGGVIATAGQVGIDPASGTLAGPDVRAQTRQALLNTFAVVEAAGARPGDIIRIGVFLTEVDDFAAMNEVYQELVPQPYPARTTVYVGLPAGVKVEIDALAVAPSDGA
jgi:2-iminobutanoate/2-iminopropanoate deaminase